MLYCRTCFLCVQYQPIVFMLGSNPCGGAAAGLIDCLSVGEQTEGGSPVHRDNGRALEWSGLYTQTRAHAHAHSLSSSACGNYVSSQQLVASPLSPLLLHLSLSPPSNPFLTFLLLPLLPPSSYNHLRFPICPSFPKPSIALLSSLSSPPPPNLR